MEFLKRQLWLAVTLGVTVVLSLPFLYIWFSSQSKQSEREKVYKKSRDLIQRTKPYYNKEAGSYLEGAAYYRDEQREKILKSQRKGQRWPLLVSGILPDWPGEGKVFEFKALYRQKIQEFMKTLNAVDVEDLVGGDITATMFAKEERFFAAQWIIETQLIRDRDIMMEGLRQAQDDIYIQEDIVEAIKRTNDFYFESMKLPDSERTVKNAVVKELVQIGIGRDYDRLPSSTKPDSPGYNVMSGGRDRVVESKGPSGLVPGQTAQAGEVPGKRFAGMTGHASNNNGEKYRVMPFRLVVIVDAGNYQELLRQLGGTRSFFIVEQVRFEIIPEIDAGYKGYELAMQEASSRLLYYGKRPIAQLVLVGESLIFNDTGRPTLKPKKEGQPAT
jgi:hypothetical protein